MVNMWKHCVVIL